MPAPKSADSRAPLALMAAVLLAVLWARLRLLSVPLERDEGEYAYTGLLFLKGFAPYQAAYTMKLPGAALAYAAIQLLFGRSASAIHLGFLLVDLGGAALLGLLARRLLGAPAAAPAAAAYAVLSLSRGVLGAFAHATHLMVLLALAGALLLLAHRERRRPALAAAAGLCFGLAVTVKQHGAVLAAAALLALALAPGPARRRAADAGLFLLGAAAPLFGIAAWVLAAGLGPRAWFWTVRYAADYAQGPSLAQGLGQLWNQLALMAPLQPLLWLAAAAGALLLAKAKPGQAPKALLFGGLAACALAVCPGLYFREHYFVLLLPPLALLAAYAVAEAARRAPSRLPSAWRAALPMLLMAALAAGGLYAERHYLYLDPPGQVSRDCYGPNPFPESPAIARYIQDHSGPGDRIGILGSEPQICFYADRLSASGHIYMYGLMEDHPYALAMQEQFIAELEAQRPLYLVVVNVPSSWLARPGSPQRLAQWTRDQGLRLYRRVGVVNIHQDGTQYYWDAQAQTQAPSPYNVTVWRRKDGQ